LRRSIARVEKGGEGGGALGLPCEWDEDGEGVRWVKFDGQWTTQYINIAHR